MNIPVTSFPGASKLFKAYISDFGAVSRFYEVDYRSWPAMTAHADRVGHSQHPRAQVAQILRRQNEAWGMNENTRRFLDALAKPDSVAVVTGQQVGIFGGPLFTIYKALTCLKLAERMSQVTGREVAPIFWLAADDDDLAEVNRLIVMTSENTLSTFNCKFDVDERRPAAQVHLTENIKNCHRAFAEILFPSIFKDEILGALSEAYAAGQTLSSAFAQWMKYLLADFGLVIMDPSDKELRSLALQLFLREVEEGSPSTAAVLQASNELEQSGFSPQVILRPGHLNLFYVDERRHALQMVDGRFATTDGAHTFSPAELRQRLHESPQNFSTNVILRPVLQDFLLPNVAYVAGPSEIAYFAQLRGVYQRFGVDMPAVIPRQSITLLEKKIERVLEKYDLGVTDFWRPVEELQNIVARRQAPEGLFEPVAQARETLRQSLAELRERATNLDSTLGAYLDKEQGKIFHQLEVIEKKLVQAAKRQDETTQQQIAKASNTLYPYHHLQERELSLISFLCKYGRELVGEIYRAIDLESFDHHIVRI